MLDSFRFGSFLGCLSGVYKTSLCGLRYLRGCEDDWNILSAGALAAFAVLIDNEERQLVVSIYAFVRSLDVFHKMLIHEGYVEDTIGMRDRVLFSMSAIAIMYAWQYEPHLLPRSYVRFVDNQGNFSDSFLKAWRNISAGQPYCLMEWCDQHKIPPFLDPTPKLLPCSIYHPLHSSCASFAFEKFYVAFVKTIPLYLPIHLFPLLFYNLKKLHKTPSVSAINFTINMSRSCLFLSSFQTIFIFWCCVMRNFRQQEGYLNNGLAAYLASTAILFEKESRRTELMLFVLPKLMQVGWSLLARKGIIPNNFYGANTLMFMLAMVCIIAFYFKM